MGPGLLGDNLRLVVPWAPWKSSFGCFDSCHGGEEAKGSGKTSRPSPDRDPDVKGLFPLAADVDLTPSSLAMKTRELLNGSALAWRAMAPSWFERSSGDPKGLMSSSSSAHGDEATSGEIVFPILIELKELWPVIEAFRLCRNGSVLFRILFVEGGGELAKGSENSSRNCGAVCLGTLWVEINSGGEGDILLLLFPLSVLFSSMGSARSPVDWKSSDKISTPDTPDCLKALCRSVVHVCDAEAVPSMSPVVSNSSSNPSRSPTA